MDNPKGLDREGNKIEAGMPVAMAVTLNQRQHFNSYVVRMCRESTKDQCLILDGPHAWGYVHDFDPAELQILHKDVNLSNLDMDFHNQYAEQSGFWKKYISSQDAHDFYVDVVDALRRQTKDYLEITDHRQAKSILVGLLQLSPESDDKIKGKIDALKIKLAAMKTRFSEFCSEIKCMDERH